MLQKLKGIIEAQTGKALPSGPSEKLPPLTERNGRRMLSRPLRKREEWGRGCNRAEARKTEKAALPLHTAPPEFCAAAVPAQSA